MSPWWHGFPSGSEARAGRAPAACPVFARGRVGWGGQEREATRWGGWCAGRMPGCTGVRDFIHWVVADGGVAGVLPPGLADLGWRPRMASSGAAIPVLVAEGSCAGLLDL